jgi:hypothetical protein
MMRSYSAIMPKKRTPKRPRDLNELAFHVGQLATHDVEEESVPSPDEMAVKRGRARAESLSAKERKKIATKAAKARWNKRK